MLANLLQPRLRYLGDKSSLLPVEMLRQAYMLVAVNIKRVRDSQPSKRMKELVLLNNNKKQNWDAKDTPNFRVCKVINDKAYDLQNPTGHVQHAAVANIQLLMPAQCIVC